MKIAVKHIVTVLTMILAVAAYGQTPPASVKIDLKDYYRHGYNNTGIDAREVRDSVTAATVSKYFVLPDPFMNPDYKYDTPANTVDFTKVNSTFAWSVFPNNASTNGSTTPIVEVTWNTPGVVDTVKVQEIPNMGVSCASKFTSIPVAVINAPYTAFNLTPGLGKLADSACYTQAQVTAGVLVGLPLNVSTQSSQVLVDYTVKKDGAAFPSLNGLNVRVANSGGTLDIAFPDYGLYEVTLTRVTDRVSRKGISAYTGKMMEGVVEPSMSKYIFRVMPPATTGPIYRVPNGY